MPQLKAAKKALRSSIRRRRVNDRWRRKVRQSLKAVRDAIEAKDTKTATASLLKAQSALDKAARHSIIHKNKAARLKSRLTKAVSQTK